MIRKPTVTNHTSFSVVNLVRLVLLLISILLQYSIYNVPKTNFKTNLQKYFHQDNLPFHYSQFYKDNCLDILADNISCCIQVKNE